MEEQIQIMKQKVLHQRRAMGGVNASKENHYMIQKQIRILENRLDKALIKFNEAISHNKKLRDSIDDLRRERVVFENIYRKMERELQDRKKQMAEIIELSNQSYEQRDTYQMEVAAIEQANRKEQEDFEEQMIELGRMLETELRLPPPGGATRPSTTGGGGRGGEGGGGNNSKKGSTWGGAAGGSMVGSASFSGGIGGVGGGVGSSGITDGTSFERIQNFEEAFNKIKGATGITDIQELVRTFIKNEDHNFSLFNYVNEQNNEIEKYEEQIQMLREEEKKYAQESGEDVHQHKQILKELEAKLQTTEAMAEKYEMKCQDLQRIIESLKRGLQSIFEKLDVDEEGFGDPVVTESNMVHYLGLIEQTANGMITTYADIRQAVMKATSEKKENQAPSKNLTSVLGTGPKVPMGQELLHVNPPKLDDYQSDDEDDDEDDEARPLTIDELKSRTLNRLQRRGQSTNTVKSKKKTGSSKK